MQKGECYRDFIFFYKILKLNSPMGTLFNDQGAFLL